jgi:predicted flap endonuclease-1-like 5' DNA nuclease
MSYPIEEIAGLSERLAAGLERAGVRTTRDLLDRARHAEGRQTLARTIGASLAELERAVQLSDLLRIKGVARQYAALLHAAGVRSAPDLRRHAPEQLHAALSETKAQARLRCRLPTVDNVRNWIADAGELQDIVT